MQDMSEKEVTVYPTRKVGGEVDNTEADWAFARELYKGVCKDLEEGEEIPAPDDWTEEHSKVWESQKVSLMAPFLSQEDFDVKKISYDIDEQRRMKEEEVALKHLRGELVKRKMVDPTDDDVIEDEKNILKRVKKLKNDKELFELDNSLEKWKDSQVFEQFTMTRDFLLCTLSRYMDLMSLLHSKKLGTTPVEDTSV